MESCRHFVVKGRSFGDTTSVLFYKVLLMNFLMNQAVQVGTLLNNLTYDAIA